MKCIKCGKESQETDKIVWKCNSCGKTYNANISSLQNIQNKKDSMKAEKILKCKKCGEYIDDGNEKIYWKCTCGNLNCGNLEEYTTKRKYNNLIKCPECGKEVADNLKVCPNCGYEIIPSETDTQETTNSSVVPVYKNKKYIGIALVVVACILFIVAFTRVNNDTYSFYKQHYKECMEGYADCKATANNYSGGLFKSSYESIASTYEKMAQDDNKKIWKYRIQAIILCFGGIACCILSYKMIKGVMFNGIGKVS